MTAARPRRALALAAISLLACPLLALGTALPSHGADAVVAEDGFDRTVAPGLGNAVTGGAWRIATGAGTVSVGNSVASFAGQPGQVLDARLSQGVARDVSVVQNVVLPQVGSGSFAMAGINARIDPASNTGYRLWFNLNGNGQVQLHANRVAPGGDVVLPGAASVDGLVASGRRIKLRLQVSGTDPVVIKGTAWRDGTPEPQPQFTTTDSSAGRITAAGQVGLALVAGQNATPVTVTHFTATATGAAPAPAPTTTAPAPAPAPTTQAPAPAPACPPAAACRCGR